MAAKKYVFNRNPEVVITATKTKEDTTIDSKEYGEILVTKGNYVAENKDGTKFGITQEDLNAFYKPAK